MKSIYQSFFRISCLVIIAMSLNSCGSDDPVEPTLQELAFEKLEGKWVPGSFVLDGWDITPNFANFSLEFGDGTYQTFSGGDLFDRMGSWAWANDASDNVIRLADQREITILNLTLVLFKFSFTQPDSGGTANGLEGEYVVTLEKD